MSIMHRDMNLFYTVSTGFNTVLTCPGPGYPSKYASQLTVLEQKRRIEKRIKLTYLFYII